MRGPIYFFAELCVRLLPLTPQGRRVFDEALADWRSEAADARGFRRAGVSARALWSVARCVVMISGRELKSREGLAPVVRLGILSALVVPIAAVVNWNQFNWVDGVWTPAGTGAVLLGSVVWVVAFFPMLALIAGAYGRRLTVPVPRLGPAIAIALVMFLAMGWLVPAAFQSWRELVFGLNAGRGPLPRGLNERSIVELMPMLFSWQSARVAEVLNVRVLWMAAVPAFLAIGITVRSMAGLKRLAGTVLPLVVFFMPSIVLGGRPGNLFFMWPSLLAAVLMTYLMARPSTASEATS